MDECRGSRAEVADSEDLASALPGDALAGPNGGAGCGRRRFPWLRHAFHGPDDRLIGEESGRSRLRAAPRREQVRDQRLRFLREYLRRQIGEVPEHPKQVKTLLECRLNVTHAERVFSRNTPQRSFSITADSCSTVACLARIRAIHIPPAGVNAHFSGKLREMRLTLGQG